MGVPTALLADLNVAVASQWTATSTAVDTYQAARTAWINAGSLGSGAEYDAYVATLATVNQSKAVLADQIAKIALVLGQTPSYGPATDAAFWHDVVYELARNVLETATIHPVPPTVASVTPRDGATSVAVDAVVSVTFSEAMTSASVTTDSFVLYDVTDDRVIHPDSIAHSLDLKTFTATISLDNGVTYKIRVTVDVTDSDDNHLAAQYEQPNGFTTE